MNDWSRMETYYHDLLSSVYPQPDEQGRIELAREAIHWAMKRINGDKTYRQVLDFGCGEGFCQSLFEYFGTAYLGIAWGDDVKVAQSKKRNVIEMDFNFLDFPDQSFDLGFSSHSLEHSPFPILTLCEWRRVVRQYLILVVPAPEWYKFKGRNHFSVAPIPQWENCFEQSGWKICASEVHYRQGNPDKVAPHEKTPDEYWFLLS